MMLILKLYRSYTAVFFPFIKMLGCYLVLFYLPNITNASNLFTIEPQLRLDPDMHTSQIDRIGVNKDCTLMVTGSVDKTARLWKLTKPENNSIPAPKLLRTFRPPINPNSWDGRIKAVAMHPDGKLVAISGYTPSINGSRWSIYIFDTDSAQIIDTIEDNPYVVKHLTFSMDGEYLAAVMDIGYGMRVWKTGNWKNPIKVDSVGYGDSYGATFDNKGRLYTIAYDKNSADFGYLRRYSSRKFELEDSVKVDGPKPYFVAVQPYGSRVAVSLLSKPGIYFYESDSEGLHYSSAANTEGVTDGIGKISWSSDGKFLFAGGSYNNGSNYLFRIWGNEGTGAPNDFNGPTGFISHLLPCGNFIAYAARDPAFGLINTKGENILFKSRAGPNMRQKQFGHLKVSEDGMRISFGLGFKSENPVIFDIKKLKLSTVLESTFELHTADYKSLDIKGWNEREFTPPERPDNPLYKGQPIAPELIDKDKESCHRFRNNEEWESLAIAPDKKTFVLGSEWRLRGYNSEKLKCPLWRNEASPGKVWAVNISRNGKLLVAAYDDGSIRWHSMKNGKELLALYVNAEDRRWIAWTPKGYFAAEVGSENLVGWHINHGPNEAASFFPVSRFRDRYWSPRVVQLVLNELDEDKAIKKAKVISNKESLTDPLQLPPEVIIHSPKSNDLTFGSSEIEVKYQVKLPFGFEEVKVKALVDGSDTGEEKRFEKKDLDRIHTMFIRMPKRNSVVSLVAFASRIKEERKGAASISLKYVGPPSIEDERPMLVGLAIGIGDNYKENKLVADDDARDFKKALETQKGRVFRDVDIKLLINSDASRETILLELKKLEAKVKPQTNSIAVVFYAGHGVMVDNKTFYIMPDNIKVPVEQQKLGMDLDSYVTLHGLSQETLFNKLSQIPGRKLLFFDACWSGNVNLTDFINKINSDGTLSAFTYAATSSGEISVECKKNGCFTQALLETLNEGTAAALYDPLNITTTEELDHYLSDNVPLYSKGASHPRMLASDNSILHFDIAK